MSDTIRIDKWLWFARFFKTRTLAAEVAAAGRIRLNSQRVTKASQNVKPSDVLTFPQGHAVRVIKVLAIGIRRGPAIEARELYEDLEPPKLETGPDAQAPNTPKPPTTRGRPTKKHRRAIDRLKAEE